MLPPIEHLYDINSRDEAVIGSILYTAASLSYGTLIGLFLNLAFNWPLLITASIIAGIFIFLGSLYAVDIYRVRVKSQASWLTPGVE